MDDYYKILGGKFDESFTHLRLRYIKQVMPCHPQNDGSKLDKFESLNEAFYVLSHLDYKLEYNAFYRQQFLNEDLTINQQTILKTTEKWKFRSLRKSRKSAKMSASDFFQSIPDVEGEKEKLLGARIFNFLFNLLRIFST